MSDCVQDFGFKRRHTFNLQIGWEDPMVVWFCKVAGLVEEQ